MRYHINWAILIILIHICSSKAKCVYERRSLSCVDGDISTIILEINRATDQHSLDDLEALELWEITFENQTIQEGWLFHTKIRFNSLILINTNLKTITPRAFVGRAFSQVKTLVLAYNQIDVISHGAFEGLIQLNAFSYSNLYFRALRIEENALVHVETTLDSITIVRAMTSEALMNITGPNANLHYLSHLDLAYGQIGDLKANSFVGAPNLKFLYLHTSTVTSIEDHAFDSPILESLDLGSNELTTLPKNLFRYIWTGITINHNPWICDCNLVWLRDMFTYYPSTFTHKEFYCVTSNGNVAYELVDFCPNNATAE